MAILCIVSGQVKDANGAAAAGAVISIERAIVDGVRSTTYETRAVADSTGAFSFTVPQGSRIRFASSDVSGINAWFYNVPRAVAANLGVYKADVATEVTYRQAPGTAAASSAGVSVRELPGQIIITLTNFLVTLVKNGTSTGGGGTLMYTMPQGLVLPQGGTSDLTIAAAGDKSFLASVGMAAAGTDGTLTSTEISFLPSTAATTSSGVGTCKMKSTVTIPTPGAPLDGTATAIPIYLNSCLNADATGVEALRYSGTITLNVLHLGDN
jgi:hypothetical protein